MKKVFPAYHSCAKLISQLMSSIRHIRGLNCVTESQWHIQIC